MHCRLEIVSRLVEWTGLRIAKRAIYAPALSAERENTCSLTHSTMENDEDDDDDDDKVLAFQGKPLTIYHSPSGN